MPALFGSAAAVAPALALLLLAPPAVAAVAPALPDAPAFDCTGVEPAPGTADPERFVCGDPRLGPAELPEDGPVASFMEGYERFGGLAPAAFLDRYATTYTDSGTGEQRHTWIYPDHDGFAVVDGASAGAEEKMEPGALLDRFGSERGSFLAPAGAPYAHRALPPDSLNTWPGGPEHNYSCYAVETGFSAVAGPIAPHFEQPGGGEQVLLSAELVPEAAEAGRISVADLLDWGYLDTRPATDCASDGEYALAS